ncbi:MAG: FkbM family methyltransferase [Acidobacteriota bacterium]
MTIKHEIRNLIRRRGFDLSRFKPLLNPTARRHQLFEIYKIDLVLDVGANTGQFGEYLRSDVDYRGRIVSFEPMKAAFEKLSETAGRLPEWEVNNFALGEHTGSAEINIAGNSFSSSILPMEQGHIDASPESKYVGRETIEVKTLDSIYDQITDGNANVFLKIDTQGFEDRILAGAENSLQQIATVQLELSFVPVYSNAPLFTDIFEIMRSMGYRLASIEEVFWNQETGQLLQVDGIFHRYS